MVIFTIDAFAVRPIKDWPDGFFILPQFNIIRFILTIFNQPLLNEDFIRLTLCSKRQCPRQKKPEEQKTEAKRLWIIFVIHLLFLRCCIFISFFISYNSYC